MAFLLLPYGVSSQGLGVAGVREDNTQSMLIKSAGAIKLGGRALSMSSDRIQTQNDWQNGRLRETNKMKSWMENTKPYIWIPEISSRPINRGTPGLAHLLKEKNTALLVHLFLHPKLDMSQL